MQQKTEKTLKLDERKWKKKRQFNYISSQTLKRKNTFEQNMNISSEYSNEYSSQTDVEDLYSIKEHPRIIG